jgi:hypothetical protein
MCATCSSTLFLGGKAFSLSALLDEKLEALLGMLVMGSAGLALTLYELEEDPMALAMMRCFLEILVLVLLHPRLKLA